MSKQKIEIEDLWRASSKGVKGFVALSFLGCMLIASHLKTFDEPFSSNTQVVVRSGNFEGLKNLNQVDKSKDNIIVKRAIYANSAGFCFAKTQDSSATVTCPLESSFGSINKVSTYTVDNDYQVKEAKFFYEPVISAKYGFMLLLWGILFAMPAYFYAKKNADPSLFKERIGKRKLFNFKSKT